MKKITLIALLLLSVSSLFAQGYGHCNFGELLSMMPETETSEKQLQAYNDQLIVEGEALAKTVQDKYAAYLAAKDGGDESPRQLAEREQKITKMQKELSQYEQKAQQQLNAKRQELLSPVIDKANRAVEAIAKENNFLLIFDTSVFNAVLFAEDTQDIMPLLKARLGLE